MKLHLASVVGAALALASAAASAGGHVTFSLNVGVPVPVRPVAAPVYVQAPAYAPVSPDRKSTRLNSSH